MSWPTFRLKHVADLNQRALSEDEPEDLEFCYVDISAVGRGCLVAKPERMRFSDAPSRARRLVRPGDTIVSTVRTYLRAVWPVTEPTDSLVVSTGFAVLSPRRWLDSRFLAWWAQSDAFIEEIVARSVGVSYPAIRTDEMVDIRIAIPQAEEQRRIAGFLDAETARIDALIEKKHLMIRLLQERESNLLHQALKVRGFRWGTSLEKPAAGTSLPPAWRIGRLSTVLDQLTNGYVGPTRDLLVERGVKYVQSLHIKDGSIDFSRRPYYVPSDWYEQRPRIHLRAGDVLLVQTGDIGQVAVVPPGFGPASCHALLIARVRTEVITGDYLGAYLRSPFGRKSLLSRVTGALHPHLEGGIRDIPIVVPPLEVQNSVVEEIRARSDLTHRIRSKLVEQIDLLREHRQALITAAVTGQLDVASRKSTTALSSIG